MWSVSVISGDRVSENSSGAPSSGLVVDMKKTPRALTFAGLGAAVTRARDFTFSGSFNEYDGVHVYRLPWSVLTGELEASSTPANAVKCFCMPQATRSCATSRTGSRCVGRKWRRLSRGAAGWCCCAPESFRYAFEPSRAFNP